MDSYLLVFAGLLLAAGTLGDRFGRRRALFTGLVDLRARLGPRRRSPTAPTELIASRALMGVGAAGIMPTTLSILTNIFPAEERPKAIAIWAAVAGMGIAIGPITGGWMIEHFDWSGIFLVNLPAVVACLVGAALLVPESRDPESPRLDLVGCGLSVAGLTRARLGADRGARARLDRRDDPRRIRRRARRRRRLHRLGAPLRRSRCSTSACSATCASARRASRSRSSTSR